MSARILLADDDSSLRFVLSQALGKEGYAVRATGNVATLSKWVRDGEGDLVLSDVYMGDECVFDALPAMRAARPNLPVIVMSAQSTVATALSAAGAGAAHLGFLRYNRPPAKVFMGDVGSLFSGAVLGGLALALSSSRADVPFLAPVALLSSFLFDATFTVLRRAARGLALRPHRTHFYQRLVLAGWPQRRVRGLYVALTAASIATGMVVYLGPPGLQLAMLVGLGALLAWTVRLTRRVERLARLGRFQRT